MQERNIGRVNVHAHGPSAWLNAFMNRQEGFVVPTTLADANTVIHTVHHSQQTGRQGLDHSLEAFHGLVDSIKSSESINRLVVITDFGGFDGERFVEQSWTSVQGASLRSEQGMSSLIVEVLAKSLANAGKEVVCVRCDTKAHPELMNAIEWSVQAPAETLKLMHKPEIPDLDGWVAVCLDTKGVHLGDVGQAVWNTRTGN